MNITTHHEAIYSFARWKSPVALMLNPNPAQMIGRRRANVGMCETAVESTSRCTAHYGILDVESTPPRLVISIHQILKNSRFFSFISLHCSSVITLGSNLLVQRVSSYSQLLCPSQLSRHPNHAPSAVFRILSQTFSVFQHLAPRTTHRPPRPKSSTWWSSASLTASTLSHLTFRTKYGPSPPFQAAQDPSTHQIRRRWVRRGENLRGSVHYHLG